MTTAGQRRLAPDKSALPSDTLDVFYPEAFRAPRDAVGMQGCGSVSLLEMNQWSTYCTELHIRLALGRI